MTNPKSDLVNSNPRKLIDTKTFNKNDNIFSEYEGITIQATNTDKQNLYVDIKKKHNDKYVIYGPEL